MKKLYGHVDQCRFKTERHEPAADKGQELPEDGPLVHGGTVKNEDLIHDKSKGDRADPGRAVRENDVRAAGSEPGHEKIDHIIYGCRQHAGNDICDRFVIEKSAEDAVFSQVFEKAKARQTPDEP